MDFGRVFSCRNENKSELFLSMSRPTNATTFTLRATGSDKKVTRSLGRSPDNCSWKTSPRGRCINLLFLIFSLCWASLLSYSDSPQPISTYKRLKNTFQMTKAYFDCSSVDPFSSSFSKWPLCDHFTLRGHNFTLALCTVLKLISN